MLTPVFLISHSRGTICCLAKKLWCRVKKSRALNSCQQHEFTSNQTSDANNASRGTINHYVVAPLRPMTSQRQTPERHMCAGKLARFPLEPGGPASQTCWETETVCVDFQCESDSKSPELLKLRLLQNKPPSDFDCLDRLHTGRSGQEPTLPGVLSTALCWLWQLNLTAWSHPGVCVCLLVGWGCIVTPLLASAREAALWLQLQHTAVSVKADRGVKPAAPRSRVRLCCAETQPTTAVRQQLWQWEESTNVVPYVSWSAERAKKVVKVVPQ